MTGIFELFTVSAASCRYCLTGPDVAAAALRPGS